MNKICEMCDTRYRLGMCDGRDGVDLKKLEELIEKIGELK